MSNSPDAGATGPVGLSIKLNGSLIPENTMITSVRIDKDIGRIPEAMVAIQSEGVEIEEFAEVDSDEFKIGSDIEIATYYGDETEAMVFKGIVVNTRLRMDSQRGTSLELFCRDKSMKLTEVRKSVKYNEKKDSDIITAIIDDAGLQSVVEPTTLTWDQLRVDSSDWDFLRLLADRNGLLVKVDAGKITVNAPDLSKKAALTVTLGVDIITYDATIDSQRMIERATYIAWNSTTQTVVTGAEAQMTDPSIGNTAASIIAGVLGPREMTTPIGADTSDAALKSFAKARMMRAGLDAIYGSCSFIGSGAIAPGDMLEIKNASDRFSGVAFVSGLTNQIEGGSWTTRVRMGLPLDWVSDTPRLARPQASGIATPVPGLQIGVVVKRHEDPDNKDRIQIKLPLLSDDPETLVWARMGTPYATSDAGIQFLPEINDEVLVGFLHDDPNAPVILGSLHNATAARPLEATEDNFIKMIITPEKLKIEFDDEKKILSLETPGGHSIVLDDDGTAIKLTDSNGNTITLDDKGITLDSTSDITLNASGKIDVTAGQDASITGANVTCDGAEAFTGKGGATAEVSASGQTTIKGAMVMIN